MFEQTECETIYAYAFSVEDDCGNVAEKTVYVTRGIDKYANCETAFAKLENGDAMCFLQEGFNRWGWTNKINPSAEPYILPLYAGAAKCDVTKGTEVGAVKVLYYNGMVSVEYIMHEGYAMSEAHVFVGCDHYPVIKQGKKETETVAPGQYPFIATLDHSTGITVNFHGVEGTIFVIAHAVTCEEICRCSDRPGPDDGLVFEDGEFVCNYTPAVAVSKSKNKSGTTDMAEFETGKLSVYPNPFSDKVYFEFVSGNDSHAVLEIFNAVGQKVTTLMDQPVEKGVLNRIEYRPLTGVSGIFLYRLTLGESIQNGRLIYKK